MPSPNILRRNLANIDADEDGTSDMKRIAVFTSGGDAQGMNAALRAVVRTGLERGLEVFAIYEGYSGMVEGGSRIKPMSWGDVCLLYTSRCV